ncbi:ATP-binding protein [Desulfoluna butyratoxydans]|uniref:histidine kinase n=1 Tax=Desulfoluna butyratoxydans TaxID=231438 RepID=A0A4U8YMH0_9BACT|nr:ATP-binding protein [Desulfoluna butyratoxydans]VFQ44931.1 histidine kinase- dna gyrase b- and hsp90-like atpase [Desulfoluna butyratoxydans]
MREISLHILDVVENGIAAGGSLMTLVVDEDVENNWLSITISDNGKGLSPEQQAKVADPFFTSRTTRRVGMGLSLLQAAAERCDGRFSFASEEGKGSRVFCSFVYDHIDRAPLGDMAMTMEVLMAGYPEVDFLYRHLYNGREFLFDTRTIRQELEGIPLNEPAVLRHLKAGIEEELEILRTERADDR